MAKKTANKYAAAAARAIASCPLMDGRTKGSWDDMEGVELTLTDAYKMSGDDGDYFCITVEDNDEEYFFTPSKLTEAIAAVEKLAKEDDVELTEAVAGIVFVVDAPVKTKNGRKFRNAHIVG